MSNSTQDFILGTVSTIDLGSTDIGGNINDRLGTINENFKKIVRSEYLKGSQGDSINVVSVDLTDPQNLSEDTICYQIGEDGDLDGFSAGELYTQLIQAITTPDDQDPDDLVDRIKLSVSLLCKRDEQGRDILVSSLPIIFIDELYLRNTGKLDPNMPCQYDLSCVIYFSETENTFKKSYSFPQIYKGTNGEFYWKINGEETQITVRGLQGPKGDPGSPIYFTTYEIQGDPGNQIYKLKQVYIQSEGWLGFDNLSDGYKQILTSGTPTISINVGSNINNPPLVFGTINASTVSNTTVYSIANSVDLGITLEMLLTNNTQGCLYLPSLKTPSDHHVMKSEIETDSNKGIFKMDVLEYDSTDSEWGEETKANDYKFINNYGTVEYTGNVTITGSGKELKSANGASIIADKLSANPSISFPNNNIQISVGGKTVTSETIPYATRSEFSTELGGGSDGARSYLNFLALKPKTELPTKLGDNLYNVNIYNGDLIYIPINNSDLLTSDDTLQITLQSHDTQTGNWWITHQGSSVYQCYINAPASVKIDKLVLKFNNQTQSFYRPATDSYDLESTFDISDSSRREIILTGYKHLTGVDWYLSNTVYNKQDPSTVNE